jgi:DNA polymerase-3 subunit beta
MNSLKIVAETKNLANLLSSVTNIVEKTSPKAVLNNVKLEAVDNILIIYATDLDISIKANITTRVIKPGEVTVSAKLLSDIIKKIPNDEVTIEYLPERDQLSINTESCEFILSTIPVKEFPVLEYFEYNNAFSLNAKDLLNLIETTAFAMSFEENRYNLNGIFLHKNSSCNLAVAATDSYRLALASINYAIEAEDFGIILPKKTTDELLKILKQNKAETITIEISPRLVKFSIANLIITSKIIEGTFPNYNTFIPEGNNNNLLLDAKKLSDAIDRVSTINFDKFKAVKLNINSVGMEISSFGQFKDVAKEYIAFDGLSNYEGESLVVGFNPKYLLDVLKLFSSELCSVKFKDGFSAVLIEKHGEVINNKFVVMPIKV